MTDQDVQEIKSELADRQEAPYDSPIKQSTDDLKQKLQELLSKAKEMAKEAEAISKSGMKNKADRQRVEFLAMKIVQDIESNLTFAARCVDEKMEKNVAHAKSEIENFVSMTFRNAGIEHLKTTAPLIIEEKK